MFFVSLNPSKLKKKVFLTFFSHVGSLFQLFAVCRKIVGPFFHLSFCSVNLFLRKRNFLKRVKHFFEAFLKLEKLFIPVTSVDEYFWGLTQGLFIFGVSTKFNTFFVHLPFESTFFLKHDKSVFFFVEIVANILHFGTKKNNTFKKLRNQEVCKPRSEFGSVETSNKVLVICYQPIHF